MNPRYFQEFLEVRIGPPKDDKLRGGELKELCDLENSTTRPNLSRRLVITLQLQKRWELETSNDLFWEIKSPSSTKEMIETGILRFFRCFSKINRKGERYKADKIRERAEP